MNSNTSQIYNRVTRLISIAALVAAGAFLLSSAGGTASASSTYVQLSSPANNAVVSGTVTISCSVSSNVEWINIDVDGATYAGPSAWASSYTTTWNSASVANGSHTIQCNGYGSDNSWLGDPIAQVTVANGTASAAPVSTPASTPSGCSTIPGTSTPVGAACFASSSYPALNNPQNPVNYGADNTGVNDSTAAINAALAAGDAYFSTPGTYLVSLNSGRGVVPPAGRTIECAPGVTLIERSENSCGNHDCGILALLYGGNTVVGCDFRGGNSASGPLTIGSNEGQFLILLSSNNDTVEGNTFENAWGNSALQINPDYIGTGPSNFLIQYNTFSHNPYYGPEVNAANSGIIQNNLQIDGGIGVEPYACNSSDGVSNVTIRNNEVMVSVGDCAVAGQYGCSGPAFISGGTYPPGCNFSSITVASNYCQGSAIQSAEIGNISYGVVSASYSNDILGSNCYCEGGGSSC